MSELLILAPAFATGVALGGIFFGGLWWTVGRGLASPEPALWFFGSMLVRMAVILAGFFLVGGENWQRWLVCLLGFVIARFAVQRLTRLPRGQGRGASYAA
jgi:F1F0 ATPase subunit 2